MGWRFVLLVKAILLLVSCALVTGSAPKDPYKVLGVPKTASQDEIRRSYRKLCLKYHPDKNVNKPRRQRELFEERFKEVQRANSQIGDKESRAQYETRTSFYNGESVQTTPTTSAEDFYRSFYSSYQSSSFRVNGVDVSDFFSALFGEQPKSIYVQKVVLPLRDLYQGRDGVEFVLNDTIWGRYRAAFRGKAAIPPFYQALAISLSTIRVIGAPLSLLVGVCVFHFNLPRPTIRNFSADIKPGWKAGTKLTFREPEPGFDVVFVLAEARDKHYDRVGNDLHTTIYISKAQAKNGFKAVIEPFGDMDDPIKIALRPGQIKESGQLITLKGKGWLKRKSGYRGDLVVTVNVVSAKHAKKVMASRLRV